MKDEFVYKKLTKNFSSWRLDKSKYLDINEVQKLRSVCTKMRNYAIRQSKTIPVRDWFMVEIGLNAGLRVQEMADLKCGDLLTDRDYLAIVVQRGKCGKKRVVKVNSKFRGMCLWFLKWKRRMGQDVNEDSYVLTDDKSNKLTKRTFQKAFKKCIAMADLHPRYSIHCLRHTYGTHLYKASNHNLKLVQEQLGHSSVKVTEVYVNLMNSDVEQAIEKLYRK